MFGKNNIYVIVLACCAGIVCTALSLFWDFQWEKLAMIAILAIMLGVTLYFIFSVQEDGKECERKENGTVFRQPKLHTALALFISLPCLLLSAFLVAFHRETEFALEAALLCSIISGIAAIVFIGLSLWKLEIQKDKFIYRNFLGITKTYYYKDVEFPNGDYGCFLNGKKVFQMPWYFNTNLLYRVWKKYRKSNHLSGEENA